MAVTVDDQQLEYAHLGQATIGDVLEHVQSLKRDRLIVQVLIDGEQPEVATVWQERVAGRTLYVETADRREVAAEVLADVENALEQADAARRGAVDQIAAGQHAAAMQQLNVWFGAWQQCQQAIAEVAAALELDLATIRVDGRTIVEVMGDVVNQLRQIKSALTNKDYVTLGDILNYEAPATTEQWRGVLAAMRQRLQGA